MLTREAVDRIRILEGGRHPVLSLYLGLRPGVGELSSVPARLKDLLGPLPAAAGSLGRAETASLRDDIAAVRGMTDRIASDLGRGVAIFRSSGAGIDEYVSLPAPMRDRALLAARPYVRPLDTTLEHFHRYCSVVIRMRKSSIFRFYMGHLETWEEMAEDEIRKQNFGGFGGYEEGRVRRHAGEVARRHYRETATRLTAMSKEAPFDLLLVGGPQAHVDGLIDALPAELVRRLAGRFTIDPHTMTPAVVQTACEDLSADYDREQQKASVTRMLDTAASGGLAVAGIEPVLIAVNHKAVATLMLQAGSSRPGFRCVDCAWLAGADHGVCPSCGGALAVVPDLLDAMSDAVRNSGGGVRNVLTETPLMTHEAGALLRFAVRAHV